MGRTDAHGLEPKGVHQPLSNRASNDFQIMPIQLPHLIASSTAGALHAIVGGDKRVIM